MQPSFSLSPLMGYQVPLLSGEPGTAQTIQLMRQLVDQALSDASFIRLATDIVRSAPAYDELGELRAIYDWVSSNIRYTKDPITKEKLYPPTELVKIRAGDCDDISMLMGALAMAVGYPARLITIAADPSAPSDFSHVYAEAQIGGTWVPMDAARPDAQFGSAPPVYTRKKAWSLSDDSSQELSGARGNRIQGTRERRASLNGYGFVRPMGEISLQPQVDPYSPSVSDLISQSIAEVPSVINSVKGNPWASFTTPYTPGYGVPQAGYPNTASSSLSQFIQQNAMWLFLGGLLLVGLKGGRR